MSVNDNNLSNYENADQDINSVPLYKKKSLWIGLVLILIVTGTGAYWFIGSLGTISTDDAFIDGNRLNISPKVLGRIVKLYADERDTVHAGQLIAELDSTDLLARLSQAKTMIENAKVSIELAKVNVEKAQIDFDRASAQYKDHILPKADYDNALKKLETTQAEYKIALSKVTVAESDLAVIKSNLDNTKLYSTIDGVVAKKWILPGDIVQPGQSILTIYDMKNIWVTAELEETKIHALKINDKAEIEIDAYPDQKFTGRIYQIGTNTAAQFSLIPPSNASGNFTKVTQRIPVKISVEPEHTNSKIKYGFLPGMSVEIKIKGHQNG